MKMLIRSILKQKSNRIFILTTFLSLSLLASCSRPAAISDSLQTQEVLQTLTSTTIPFVIRSTPIPTLAGTSPTAIVSQCLGSKQDRPTNLSGEFVLSGNYIIYQPERELHQSPSYILMPATNQKIPLGSTNSGNLSNFIVSPNRKMLSYFTPTSNSGGKWNIVGNDGNFIKELPGKPYPEGNWQAVIEWIDDNHLLISKFSKNNPYPSIVFNPSTGKTEQVLQPDYPDIFLGPSGMLSTWRAYSLTETVYSPDLTMVVYPQNPSKIILWDVKNKKLIAEITDPTSLTHAPLWLSGGKEFVIDVTSSNSQEHWYRDELVSVGVDGQVRQLTHLADQFTDVFIQQYSESADGRFIAIWFNQVGKPSQLAIYDTVSKETKVYCINAGGYTAPVWSPSGHQLLVDGYFDSIDDYGTILVDVDRDLLAQVEKGVIPVGWMLSPTDGPSN